MDTIKISAVYFSKHGHTEQCARLLVTNPQAETRVCIYRYRRCAGTSLLLHPGDQLTAELFARRLLEVCIQFKQNNQKEKSITQL